MHVFPSILFIGMWKCWWSIFLKDCESHLIISEDDGSASQLFIACEDDSLMELPTNTIGEGIVYLMDNYYVFNVQYQEHINHFFCFSKTSWWTNQMMVKGLQDIARSLPQ